MQIMKFIKNILRLLKNVFRIVKARIYSLVPGDKVKFNCNICGTFNVTNLSNLSREIASCYGCGSTVRMRSIVHVLSMELFGESLVLKDFPEDNNIKGVGMSDWDGYANPLASKLDYTNTYFHQEPKLDVTDISKDKFETLDFIISSDVYEHVLYPVSRAFENTKNLLKNDGVFVFTVPYTKEGDETVEHFGELNDFEITKQNGTYVLKDIDKSGNKKVYNNLVFHGGPGTTLEMRVFCEKSMLNELKNAGFSDVKIYSDDYMKYGIYCDVDWSLPVAARL